MKKILTYILIVLIIVAVAIVVLGQSKDKPIVIVKGNLAHKPLPIKLNKTNDTECAMLIKTEENAAEVVAPNGDTWFFDDPGCMVKWLQDKKWKDKATLWVHTIDTKRWIKAQNAKFTTTYHSAMHYGFGAKEKGGNNTISFEQMVERMKRGETLANPKYRKKILGEHSE